MIRIIKGTYGYVDDNGYVRPKTEKDGPFALTDEQEARLVALGVAVYVDAPPAEENGPEEQGNDSDEQETVAQLDAEQLKELTNAKLKELAEEMGIDTDGLRTKAQLIDAITAVDVVIEPPEDDEDDLPQFDAAEAVQ